MTVQVIKFVDGVFGSPICFFLGLLGKICPKKEIKIKKILMIQLWGIGESILTLPAIHALRKKYPKATINVLATERNRDIYYKQKDSDNVLLVDLGVFSILVFMFKNIRKYDLVIDMEEYLNISSIMSFFVGKKRIGFANCIRGMTYTKKIQYNDKQHTAYTFMDLARLVGAGFKFDRLIRLEYDKKDRDYVNKFLIKNRIKNKDKIIGICAGAAESSKSRMWPKENFAELADIMAEKYNAKIVFVGADYERELNNSIIKSMKNRALNTAGLFSLKQLFYFAERCNLFISNDTGPMHIAAAQGTKTIGLFGPNTPVRWAPFGKGNISIYKKQPCSPCIHTHLGIVPECKFKTNKCMQEIKVKDVLDAIKKIL